MINESNAKKLQSGNESIAKAINAVGTNKELLLKFGEETARRAMGRALCESGCEHWANRASAWMEEGDHLSTPVEIKDRFTDMAVRGIAHRATAAILDYARMIHGANAAECAVSISLQSIDTAKEIKWWNNENSDAEAMLLEQEEQLKCIMELIDAEKDNTETIASTMYEVTHMPELLQAIEEYNAGGRGHQINAEGWKEYATATDAVKDLAGLEMEDKKALEYLEDYTMVLSLPESIIVQSNY